MSRLTSVTGPWRTTDLLYLPPTWNQWQPGSRIATTSVELAAAAAGSARPRAAIAVRMSLRIVDLLWLCRWRGLIRHRRGPFDVREDAEFAFGELRSHTVSRTGP